MQGSDRGNGSADNGAAYPATPGAPNPGPVAVAAPPTARRRPTDPPDASPPPHLLFRRHVRPIAMLRELLGSRELIMALTERDFRARYKQTKVGVAWAVLTPLLLLGAFWIFSNTAADFDTKGIPYMLFSIVALVPWTFFSNGIAAAAMSITQNLSLVNKVYCPREVFPLASIGTAGVDAFISLLILVGVFAAYGQLPHAETVWVPVLLVVQIMFMIGVALLLSALVVYLRDVRQILPLVLQFALFATPIAYSFDELAEEWQPLASAINPLAPVIESYRDTILLGQSPEWHLIGIAAAASAAWLIGGYLLFKRLETGFADVA